MGLLPLQFGAGQSIASLGLTGRELLDLVGSGSALAPRGRVAVEARREDGSTIEFAATVRIDTPDEMTAFRHGGILPFVLRRLAGGA
jgi:aconitate hydratase